VPIIGAYQVGNTNFAALWLWHRTNIYNLAASTTVTGNFPLSGLQAGTYNAMWWDTFKDVAISNFTFTISGTNPATIVTPPILRSAALFAGKAPAAGFSFPILTQTLGTNSPALSLPLAITNSGGLPLSYSLSVTGASPVTYAAINSTQTGGPVFAWKDISGVGTNLTGNFTALAAPKTAKDEGIAGPVDIGFGFPFFSGGQSPGIFNQIYVSPNGFVTFSPFAGDTSTNQPLPSATAPTNLIAFFWDDLDLGSAGRVYALSDPIMGTFTLQFQNVLFKGSGSTANCQLLLKTSGEILIQYKGIGISNSCTVGIQNGAGNQGLQVAFNQSYVQSNLCLRIAPAPWLGLSANANLVPKSSTETVNVTLNPAGLAYGTYQASLLLSTGDPGQALTSLPITLSVTPIATWRQANFGTANNSGSTADTADPDNDGLMNILEYAFNTNPNAPNAPPISYALLGDHLTITFKRTHPAPPDITYIYEVTDDVVGGVWQSGPSYTSQSLTDNLDGTETVVVTDSTTISGSAAHYLRVRVGSP